MLTARDPSAGLFSSSIPVVWLLLLQQPTTNTNTTIDPSLRMDDFTPPTPIPFARQVRQTNTTSARRRPLNKDE
jgi:hypothetical protein